ncbi:response regulator [Fulvivirga sp. M361]|uniref:response regulator n=1 Tax=Fulvivirga sp. M361 TaxID=2594266 RepID=UPI001179A922|nr:response regulator [Fulvivirga sp. M361]TRX61212.1 response regulator [Fulvivirga sp. M361]
MTIGNVYDRAYISELAHGVLLKAKKYCRTFAILTDILWVILLWIPIQAFAQEPYQLKPTDPVIESWRWSTLTELQGKNVRCVNHAFDSTLWFGTDNALIHYDGYTWQHYAKPDSISGTPVLSVYPEKKGNVFFGTDEGLFKMDESGWTKIFPVNSQLKASVKDIIRLPDGTILASLAKQGSQSSLSGLLAVGDSQLTLYTSTGAFNELSQKLSAEIKLKPFPKEFALKGSKETSIEDLSLGASGKLYLAISEKNEYGKLVTYDHYSKLGTDEYQLYDSVNGPEFRGEAHVEEAPDGKIWVISNAHNLSTYFFDGQVWHTVRLSDLFGGIDSQNSLMITDEGAVWIGGYGRFFIYENERWKEYKYPDVSFSSSSRLFFSEAPDGKILVVDKLGEGYLYNNTNKVWRSYPELIFQLENVNERWFLSYEGKAVLLKNGSFFSHGTEQGLIDTPVKLFNTSYGEIWAIGSHKGFAAVAFYNGNSWEKRVFPEVSWGFDYRAVYEASDGSVWIGSSADIRHDLGQNGGVVQFLAPQIDKDSLIHYSIKTDPMVPTACYGIGESCDGTMWFGGRAIWRLNENNWAKIDSLIEFEDYTDFISTDPNYTVWFGSRHYGIFKLDSLSWTQYTMNEGLPGNNIFHIHTSGKDEVWAVTRDGVGYFDGVAWSSEIFPSAFDMLPEMQIKKGLENEYWLVYVPSEWIRRGLSPGISDVKPSQFKTIRYTPGKQAPQTTIESYSTEIQAGDGENVVFWSGKDYMENTNDTRLEYSWRLNESEWSPFRKKSYQQLIGLAAGNYHFQVRARDHDFNIETVPATIEFEVIPPWWFSWQFILIIAIALLIIVILEVRIIRRNKTLGTLNSVLQKKSESLQKQNVQIEAQKQEIKNNYEDLKHLSQSRLQFFTNVSHEFRTPLGLIQSPLEELVKPGKSLPKTLIDKYHLIIQRNANRLFRLVNQILEVYKIEHTTLDFSPSNGDIISFVRDILELFDQILMQKEIKLTIHTVHDTLFINFDHDKIEKIIFNLLSNAIKNVTPPGEITVAIAKMDNIEGAQSTVRLEVIDNGVGIPKDHQTRIFERFFHIDSGSQEDFHSGVGIGLAYIKDLVHAHGGDIRVKSDPGECTVFTVDLPYIPLETQSDHTSNSISTGIYKALEELEISLISNDPENVSTELYDDIKVLMIEDDPDTLFLMSQSLGEYFVIMEASDGKEGYKLAKEEKPDLIITDIMLPGMSGVELCSRLKEDLNTSHIPILLLSAKTTQSDRIDGYEAGADGYLDKPLSLQLLRSRVFTLINNRRKLQARSKGQFGLQSLQTQETSSDDAFINKLLKTIEHFLGDSGLDAEKLSQEMGVSRVQLYRKVKTLTDQTVNELIKSIRLKHAESLLRSGKFTVAEVAYKTGFNAPNNFATYFKKHFHKSPSEYIKK